MADEYEVYELGDYRYKIYDTTLGECDVEVIDTTKSSYENMPATIVFTDPGSGVQYTLRVTGLGSCFKGCANLVASPSLSANAESLSRCFEDCLSLTTAPTIPNSVVSMFRCFENCRKLETPPSIPASVTSMAMCFEDCRALTTAPAIPASVNSLISCFENCKSMATPPDMANVTSVRDMDSCFRGCESMTTAPIIPSSVDNMPSCFRNCKSITTPPTIPNSVGRMDFCFDYCTSLTTAPIIPASVTGLSCSFRYCTSLAGNVVVNGVQYYGATDMFLGTEKNIYIINGAGTSAVETAWKTIASEYSNVHYEADDNPTPALSMSVARVDTAVSETPSPTGEYAFIKATAVIYDTYIPDGWSVVYDEDESITKDNVLQSPYWTRTNVGNTYTLKCWFSLGDTSKHTFTLQVSDSIKDASDNTKVIQLSPIITQILSKAYKLVDYYHDPTTQTEGMSIGKFATEADLFDIDMPALFRDTVSIEDNNNVARQLFDFIYPVGSYYETSDATFDPNDTWGGTWVLETAGQFHISAGTGYTIGATGGWKDAAVISHYHNPSTTSEYFVCNSVSEANNTRVAYSSSGNRLVDGLTSTGTSSFHHRKATQTVGESGTNRNLPPYVAVNRWHRTA